MAEEHTADELTSIFARMSGLLLSHETLRTVLNLVVSLARETHPVTVGAGITLIDKSRKVTAAATGPEVERADALQYELDEGPCLTAWQDRRTVRIDDLRTDPRWRRWASAVVPLGLRATLSAPLVAADDTIGAMKLYSSTPAAYSDDDEAVLVLFAAQAAILLANVQSYENARRLSEQLKEALRSRDVIGQAKGILMAQRGIEEDAAFAVLVRLSQHSQEKLRDVARRVVETAARRKS